MSDYFLGEIRLFSFAFPPKGWALCDGTILSINQNQALFYLLSNQFGGDGRTTFALPDLRGRTAAHAWGFHTGSTGGSETVTLTQANIPAHTHAFAASSLNAAGTNATNATLGVTARPIYAPGPPSATLATDTVTAVGGGQGHANLQPYLVLNYCIALYGLFPPHP